MYAHSDESMSKQQLASLDEFINRRKNGEPIAYITGTRSFWAHDFKITSDTLVPRPETELLVETVLDNFNESPITVVDLGTGSGVIAISLGEARHAWQITAVDVSRPALDVARQNGAHLQNVHWIHGAWYQGVDSPVDLIVSNPPYVAERDPHLTELGFEPDLALLAGPDGLDCIREIICQGYDYLKNNGFIILEHGYDQQTSVIQLLEQAGFTEITPLFDLQHQPRAVSARRLSI